MIDARGVVLLTLLPTLTLASAQGVVERFGEDSRSSRAGTRINAVRALAASKHPRAVELAAPLLLDANDGVQLETIDAILSLYLAPAPSQRQSSPFEIRNGSAAESIFEAAPLAVLPHEVPPVVIQNLVKGLGDESTRVRVNGAFALGVLASGAVSPLSPDAARTLSEQLVHSMRHEDPATREALVRVVGRIYATRPGTSGSVVIGDALVAALNDVDSRVRTWAADSLGWLRYERAVQALTDRLNHLRRSDEGDATLHALARIGHSSSQTILNGRVEDRRATLRVMAIEGLGRVGDSRAVPTITAAIQRERDEAVRLAGAFTLLKLGDVSHVQAIVAALIRSGTARQAQVYLTELGASIAPALHPSLQHTNPAIRQAVAEVLGLSGHAGSIEALEAVRQDPDPAVKEAVRQALVRLRALPNGVLVH